MPSQPTVLSCNKCWDLSVNVSVRVNEILQSWSYLPPDLATFLHLGFRWEFISFINSSSFQNLYGTERSIISFSWLYCSKNNTKQRIIVTLDEVVMLTLNILQKLFSNLSLRSVNSYQLGRPQVNKTRPKKLILIQQTQYTISRNRKKT